MNNDSTKPLGPFTLAELAEHEAKRKAPAPWGEAHRREARICCRRLSIAAEIAGEEHDAYVWGVRAESCDTNETRLRSVLGGPGTPYLDAARIDREVRRVRGLAEGRLVRSETTGYKVTLPDGGRSNVVTKQQAIDGADPMGTGKPRPGWGTVHVRVTRIRRAP